MTRGAKGLLKGVGGGRKVVVVWGGIRCGSGSAHPQKRGGCGCHGMTAEPPDSSISCISPRHHISSASDGAGQATPPSGTSILSTPANPSSPLLSASTQAASSPTSKILPPEIAMCFSLASIPSLCSDGSSVLTRPFTRYAGIGACGFSFRDSTFYNLGPPISSSFVGQKR